MGIQCRRLCVSLLIETSGPPVVLLVSLTISPELREHLNICKVERTLCSTYVIALHDNGGENEARRTKYIAWGEREYSEVHQTFAEGHHSLEGNDVRVWVDW